MYLEAEHNSRNGRRRSLIRFLLPVCLLTLAVPCTTASAAFFSGTVQTAANTSVAGAMVTVFSEDRARKQTVYTDALGAYVIRTPFAGRLIVRVRVPFFEDHEQEITGAVRENLHHDVVLNSMSNEAEISAALTASAHVATLEWESPESRTAFVSQCNYCHQVGNSLTRRPRARGEWAMTVRRMQGYGVMLDYDEASAVIDTLHKGFDGTPVKSIQTHDFHPTLADAKVEEWLVGDGLSFIHDTEVGEDGHLYGADEGHDIIWELDMASNRVTEHNMPDPGLPVGGLLSAFPLPLGIFTGKHGPHSLAEDEHGKFWITNALSSHLLSFDTHTKEFEQYNVGDNVIYPHTIRIDKEGIIWFTIAVTNQVARFDPATEAFTIIDLPVKSFWDSLTYAMIPRLAKLAAWLPIDLKKREHAEPGSPLLDGPYTWGVQRSAIDLPYGIDINPIDGTVWYAKLNGNKIGVIDPKTLEIGEFDTPLDGPRRLRFDSKGILWIPSFDESSLLRFDPAGKTFEQYPMPVLAEGEWETPYALNVHPTTDEIWITSNNSDRIFRFNQETETFVSYPSPSRVTFLRDLVFTKDGRVCSSQSNLPAYAIEDGRPSFICIDPEGGLKDRQAQTALIRR